ncbi:TonB-dependent receptor [Mesohalobacter halotolerans]|uniref:isocitrate dehydrogenase (NADP(+)) n=1 Tax=Mesohalobacter halotolerans TaxID=1883405 RepID=A0A4V6AMG9_9FLAO|nr:TonB-dependent receptor [Mesohalobacter halotolerans]TKS56205.1 TonB-dependent receptor [Mesohalobacter halotolerans]
MKIIWFLLLIAFSLKCLSQEKFSVSGKIKDIENNETLLGVNIIVEELQTGTVSNAYGFYSLTLPKGQYTFTISYLGFETLKDTIKLNGNIKKNFFLTPASEQLEEITIRDNFEQQNIRKPEMSINRLKQSTIKQIPVVFGEADVLRSIVQFPGVTNAGEGSSGFNVRGGSADQNLILLDEAVIFNSSHLFGLFSIFNPEAVKDLKLYKGGIPAEYGGRVSSVLDIKQKDGNYKEFQGEAGVGVISSKLLLEGPIQKNKSSFLVSGRSTYAHLFLKAIDNPNAAYFYDFTAKGNYIFNDKNKLMLSGYFGRDFFSLDGSFDNIYGNSFINLRWNHVFNDQLFSNMSIIGGEYIYELDLDIVGFNFRSGIQNLNLKYDFNHYLSDEFQLNYGLNSFYYVVNPGKIKPTGDNSGITEDQLTKKYAIEPALFLSAEHQFSDNFSAEYGLRWSSFFRLGQDELNIYDNNLPLLYNQQFGIYQRAEPIGTRTDSRSDVIKTFHNLEPRIALAYALDNNTSLKASYNRMAQYLHLITNTNSPTPLDVWAPSGPFIEPQLLDQFAVGYFKSFEQNKFDLSIEAFYKTVDNKLDFIDGADLIAADAIEQETLNGEARSYGLELMLKKNRGRLNGWIAYTLSRAEQRTPGRFSNEPGINNGKWYLANYDKTHDLTVLGNYKLNKQWTFNLNFNLRTGQPVNFPVGQFNFQGLTVPIYEGRNNDRLPIFHRLDVSATYRPKAKREKKWKGYWNFGIYNIYNRRNAASISFEENRNTGQNEAVRFSIFGIVPSVSYNISF